MCVLWSEKSTTINDTHALNTKLISTLEWNADKTSEAEQSKKKTALYFVCMRRCQFMRPGPKIECGASESMSRTFRFAHTILFFLLLSMRVCIASFALVLILLPLLLPILVLLWFCFCHFVRTIDLLSYICCAKQAVWERDSFIPNFIHASRVHIRTRQH